MIKKQKNTLIDVADFDLKKSVEETIQEMVKAKDDDPNLLIPTSFLENYSSNEMTNFIKTTCEYCIALFKVELGHEHKHQTPSNTLTLPEPKDVAALASEMAKSYGKLVLGLFYQRKNSKDEQNFFETLIYFIAKVMQPIFEKDQIKWLEDELNRLFRSTAFNISRRKHLEFEKNKKFPMLKTQKKNPDSIIHTIMLRNAIPKNRMRVSIPEATEFKPCYVKLSAYSAITARSPMISMILPSPTDKVRAFEL